MNGGTALPSEAALSHGDAAPCAVAAGVTEQALVFDVGGQALVGVLSRPLAAAAGSLALVIVVGGPQYRVGSHRQFVELARAAARAGHVALRFDVRGMGDADGAPPGFESLDDDIAAALAALRAAEPALHGAVLCGLCDGASAALLYVQRRGDAFVRGLALLNPWVRSPQTQAAARVKHYYLDRLRSPSFWRKLFAGGVARGALADAWASLSAMRGPGPKAAAGGDRGGLAPGAPFQLRMAAAWGAFAHPLLLVLSGRDHTAREFEEAVAAEPVWRGALGRAALHRLPDADHTLSEPAQSRRAEALLCAWLRDVSTAAAAAGSDAPAAALSLRRPT